MTIDWINFTPWMALAGGVLIGAAAGLFVVLNGRIAGISGLLASLLERGAEGRGEKALFLLGILLAPLCWLLMAELPAAEFQTNWLGLLAAGLLRPSRRQQSGRIPIGHPLRKQHHDPCVPPTATTAYRSVRKHAGATMLAGQCRRGWRQSHRGHSC